MASAFFFFSSRRRHTRLQGDWSSDVCSSDLNCAEENEAVAAWLAEHRRQRTQSLIDRRSEEHTSELQSPCNLVCRLLLEKKKNHTEADPLLNCSPTDDIDSVTHLATDLLMHLVLDC